VILDWLQKWAWQLAFLAVACGSLYGFGYMKGKAVVTAEYAEQQAAAAEVASLRGRAALIKQTANEKAKDDRIKAIDDDLRIAVDELRRTRSERMPASAAAACQGSTGRELARPDAEFLEGYSADRRKWIAEVIACQASEDELRALLTPTK